MKHSTKSVLVLIMVLLSSSGFSQKLIVTPTGLVNADDTSKHFVVIKVDSVSAKDLYARAYSYIQHTWKNPDIANSGKVEGEFLHVRTFVKDAIVIKNSFVKVYINFSYSLNLDFKDSKVRFEIVDLEMRTDDSYAHSLDFTKIGGLSYFIYNKDGELKRPDDKDHIEAYFNNEINGLKTALITTVPKSDF